MNLGPCILAFALVASGSVEVARAGPPAARATSSPANLQLREGDLVFHRSRSAQSQAVALATGSAYTHMGVVLVFDGRPVVLEAVQPVKLTPLPVWIARGEKGRVVVKRLRDAERVLTPAVTLRMRRLAKSWLGRPYDLHGSELCKRRRISTCEVARSSDCWRSASAERNRRSTPRRR